MFMCRCSSVPKMYKKVAEYEKIRVEMVFYDLRILCYKRELTEMLNIVVSKRSKISFHLEPESMERRKRKVHLPFIHWSMGICC